MLTAKPLDDAISAPEEVAFLRMLAEVDKKVAEDVAVDRISGCMCKYFRKKWRRACYKKCRSG